MNSYHHCPLFLQQLCIFVVFKHRQRAKLWYANPSDTLDIRLQAFTDQMDIAIAAKNI